MVQCCFTSTETVGSLGWGAQDVHLNFHTAPELCILNCSELLHSASGGGGVRGGGGGVTDKRLKFDIFLCCRKRFYMCAVNGWNYLRL